MGETGCGKSTQLPQYLHENGWSDGGREVVCTQPRRMAATTLADRVSREVSDPSLVGYSVRFASTYNPGVTRIRYVTDGWLLREATLLDPLLRRCSVLIIDEAHERSLNTELLLGAVKKIRRARPELRVVICSATLDAESFLEFFVGGRRKSKTRRRMTTTTTTTTTTTEGECDRKRENLDGARSTMAQATMRGRPTRGGMGTAANRSRI